MEIIFEFEEIREAAKSFMQVTKNYKIFAFTGELGAGKTTFINALCKEMGITETVTSPTFSIIQEYNSASGKIVYHMDLYRIKNKEEAMNAGVEECINSNEICMVEWPEKAPEIFPEQTVYARFEIIGSNKRKLIVELPQ
ncbi:MAG TPA: tRNA (adenosine(37)-N6)-threonylcarbamoyltransferase complex ATPase subunit type 1 TsaE [Hanamia sp.]|nr:tRNA (adenosine(37)-N6)-threonylcarbamoyltransferase complex ATPase subunit type 1 TsaE [Hanamia sp.]